MTSYDHKNRTIIAKIFDYNGNLISYKRRRYLIPGTEEPSKWVTKAQTSPNKQCYINVPHNGPIYIIEGHHDELSAALLQEDNYNSFNYIMVPTENYREFNEIELKAVQGREINFIMDVKKDDIKKSAIPMMALANSLPSKQNEDAVLINLFDFLEENKIKTDAIDKLDLSESLEYWNGSRKEFTSSLEYHADCIRNGSEIF